MLPRPMPPAATAAFEHQGHRLVYSEYGSGQRPVILLPGLLLSRKMHAPLAEALAEKGNRVVCLDLLGHGESDRPRDMWRYSMPLFAEQAVGLLHPLQLGQGVVGGAAPRGARDPGVGRPP